jgi:site-specific recombinase XerD
MSSTATLPVLLESFFLDRLGSQLSASPHTIASYRDAFCLLLAFANRRLKKPPSALKVSDLDAPFIGSFLDHLERERGNSARTRNVRLAAIHSFFQFVAFKRPEYSALIQRVLAIPAKRHPRPQVTFLSPEEVKVLLSVPDQATWGGRRASLLMQVALETGLRVSELTGLRRADVVLGPRAYVGCRGKGRKQRSVPLQRPTAKALRAWLHDFKAPDDAPLFPNAGGGHLSRDGVAYILRQHVERALERCPSLRGRRISPHILRHTLAMNLLRGGIDRTVVALWLGHESVATTDVYFHADVGLSERALEKAGVFAGKRQRFRPDDSLLAFLRGL